VKIAVAVGAGVLAVAPLGRRASQR
jgi:hypothetical protein